MKSQLLTFTLLVLLTRSACAWDAKTDQVRENLRKNYPKTEFSVTPSMMEGIYEITAGSNRFYTNINGRVFIFGEMLDPYSLAGAGVVSRDEPPTAAAQPVEPEKLAWANLPLENAIKTVKGTGARKLAIFTDPDCPYCRKLESELSALNDVTIYYFPYPLTHPAARAKIDIAWCAQNPVQTWDLLMQGYVVPSSGPCPSSPVDRNLLLGRKFSINGTPFIFSENGKAISGWAPKAKIETLFEKS